MTRAPETLVEFLEATDARFRFFDLGRRLSRLPRDSLLAFERTHRPYPLPHKRQAWLGVLIWKLGQPEAPLIWFLRLPLDEQGKLVQAARDDFLQRLARCTGDLLQEEEDPLKDNPFAFRPDPERMAAFHAAARRALGQPASDYYAPVVAFLEAGGSRDWETLGLQGIADFCARLDQDANEARLCRALPGLPQAPLNALALQLEHQRPSHRVAAALSQRLVGELKEEAKGEDEGEDDDKAATLSALLRGLSQTPADGIRLEALEQVLNAPAGAAPEILAAIATRYWSDLMQPRLCLAFLERLAASEAGQAGFNQLVAELLYMPGMRDPLMSALRQPERSPDLTQAIGGFFSALRAAQS